MGRKQINPTELTEEQIDYLIDGTLAGEHGFHLASKLGFFSKSGFWSFLENNPELKKRVAQARFESCVYLEDDLLNMHLLEKDAKMARVRSENIAKVLAFRNPAVYSQRLDLNVNQHVSIKLALDAANAHVMNVFKEIKADDEEPVAIKQVAEKIK